MMMGGAVGNNYGSIYPGGGAQQIAPQQLHHHHHHAGSLGNVAQGNVPIMSSQKMSRTPDISTITNSTSAIQGGGIDSYLRDEGSEGNDIPEEIRNKITFILNNLSIANMDDKVVEMRQMLENEATQTWFSKVLVFKRAAQEQPIIQNNYLAFLSKIAKKSLYNLVIKETFNCMNKVISDERIATQNESDKKTLKNIGRWLGQLTLARNKPIVMKYMNIKSLLIDAYKNSRFGIIIPLVCKILEGAKDSVVFKPKNPWMGSLLSLLSEIHNLDLKISLKCEIQLLLKELNIVSDSIVPSNLLTNITGI